jgi:apolipoprotein D and lipocalin family protein
VHRLIVLCLLLAGCAARQDAVIGPFRDPAIPIYSAAVFDQSRFAADDWQQVAAFLPGPAENCADAGLHFPEQGNAARASYRLCLANGLREGGGAVAWQPGGRLALPGIAEPLWVLWVDADYRTVLVGTPSGALGFILNRGGALPADRLAAAREIFDFNGYDLSRLVLLR